MARKINSQNFADAQGRIISSGNIITSGCNIVSTTSSNGFTRTIMSGCASANGEPIVRTITERRNGNYLYHNDITFHPRTNTTENIHWRLDLTNPNAKPENITDEE